MSNYRNERESKRIWDPRGPKLGALTGASWPTVKAWRAKGVGPAGAEFMGVGQVTYLPSSSPFTCGSPQAWELQLLFYK